ncbi:glycoside hydrolase family 99-like domain-containing protein [Acidibrevibacterium fodinaquatile]|uniref:glycoside hydrolase family 99-like domain-containing protein n=1 Tax=Acidibrevibacterium fodinaquatile TaxID=1969806 RepID=UPI000E0DB93A|nr:glycoside hydrolase family 99-like domain-containing protein [Acidibrevibacterium fodinaquatile]
MAPDDFAYGVGYGVGQLIPYSGLTRLTPDEAALAGRDTARELDILRCSGLFDAAFYLHANPDIASSGVEPLTHYHLHGWAERRRPNFYFDPAFYLDENPDVRAAEIDPLLHYVWAGEREGRRPVLYFDPAWYRARYAVPEDEICLAHFLARRLSGETSPLAEFDSAWYLKTYPDIAAAGMDPFEHFLVQGHREGRNPSPGFDVRFYRRRYLRGAPDENPLLHYLRHRGEPGIHPSCPPDEVSLPREMRRNTRPGLHFETVEPVPATHPSGAKVLAFYLPQFHPCPENDAWWGKGFTEWTNLGRALPRFAGHYQPRIPRDLGHYRLDGAETLARQIELAKGAALGGFVFYFYWFNRRRLLDQPIETFLANPHLDFPFCLMWANENWTRQWDGMDQQILIAQEYRPEDEAALIACFARHFADPRYIRIAGRPLLFIYRAALIPDSGAAIARWRQRFRTEHGEDPLLVMAQSFTDHDPRAHGLDGAVEFPPHKLTTGLEMINDRLEPFDPDFSAEVYDYDDIVIRSLTTARPDYPLIKTAIPGWDNDPRREGGGLVVHGATPARYQAWLGRLIDEARARPFHGEPLVCINAWNEWAEGAYLEPDVHFGAAFLNATGRAITGRPASAAGLVLVGHDALAHGAQQLLLHLGRHLRRHAGLAVTFLLRDGGPLEAEYAKVAPTLVVREDDAFAATVQMLYHEKGVRSAIVNTTAAAALCPHFARHGIAVTLLVHEMPRLIEEKQLLGAARAAAAHVRHAVFPAALVRERFTDLIPLAATKTHILPQGLYQAISFDAEARRTLRARFAIPPDAVLAIAVGYGDLRKGFDLFLQTWRAARRRARSVHFAWVGRIDRQLEAYLGPEIEAAKASGTCHFPGFCDDVAAWLSAADALLLPSREDPYPSVMLEAAAAGIPVIAFAESGGAAEFIRREAAGEVVSFAECEAMARALLALTKTVPSPEERQRRGAATAAKSAFGDYASGLLALALPDLVDISVVVPNFNYARFLRARLASIFGQTYPVREVIVLDDASSDDSIAVAEATAREWQRDIRVIANARPSGSVFAQWRRAAEVARGEFLWIAEADDAAEPQFLEKLAASLASAADAVFAFADSRAIDAEDRTLFASYRGYYAEAAGEGALGADDVFSARGFARRFLAERNLILNASSLLWRRQALLTAFAGVGDDLGRFRLAGDWRLYLEALTGAGEKQAGGSVAYVAAPLNLHRRHEASVTARLDPARHVGEIRAMHRLAAARLGGGKPLRARQAAYLHHVIATLRKPQRR